MAKRSMDGVPRTPAKKRQTNSVSVARVNKIEQAVRSIKSSQERKYFDNGVAAGSAVSYDNAFAYNIFQPPEGSGNTERVGRKCRPTWVDIRGNITCPNSGSAGSTTPNTVRVLLIRSKQRFLPSLTTSATANNRIFQYNGVESTVNSPFDASNRTHFEVLHDETIDLGFISSVTSPNTASPVNKSFHIRRKLTKQTTFEDSSTTIESGGYYVCLVSNKSSTVGVPRVIWYSRITYTDA